METKREQSCRVGSKLGFMVLRICVQPHNVYPHWFLLIRRCLNPCFWGAFRGGRSFSSLNILQALYVSFYAHLHRAPDTKKSKPICLRTPVEKCSWLRIFRELVSKHFVQLNFWKEQHQQNSDAEIHVQGFSLKEYQPRFLNMYNSKIWNLTKIDMQITSPTQTPGSFVKPQETWHGISGCWFGPSWRAPRWSWRCQWREPGRAVLPMM